MRKKMHGRNAIVKLAGWPDQRRFGRNRNPGMILMARVTLRGTG
jgi:hypothetical protein